MSDSSFQATPATTTSCWRTAIVVVEQGQAPKVGDIVVAIVENEFTLKLAGEGAARSVRREAGRIE